MGVLPIAYNTEALNPAIPAMIPSRSYQDARLAKAVIESTKGDRHSYLQNIVSR